MFDNVLNMSDSLSMQLKEFTTTDKRHVRAVYDAIEGEVRHCLKDILSILGNPVTLYEALKAMEANFSGEELEIDAMPMFDGGDHIIALSYHACQWLIEYCLDNMEDSEVKQKMVKASNLERYIDNEIARYEGLRDGNIPSIDSDYSGINLDLPKDTRILHLEDGNWHNLTDMLNHYTVNVGGKDVPLGLGATRCFEKFNHIYGYLYVSYIEFADDIYPAVHQRILPIILGNLETNSVHADIPLRKA